MLYSEKDRTLLCFHGYQGQDKKPTHLSPAKTNVKRILKDFDKVLLPRQGHNSSKLPFPNKSFGGRKEKVC